jgi:hypothetical protein
VNLNPMTMPQEAAEAAFREYRAAFMAERNQIDGELMRGYKALREGKQLIRLSETIAAGGVDDQGRPRLAIARADEASVQVTMDRDGSCRFAPAGNVRARDRVFQLPPDTLPRNNAKWLTNRWATMPLIPPRLRPRHSLSGYHVLWEAVWRAPNTRRAPHDPALLKHIGGDLYAVLAVWDLTDLERAVLEMRAS